MIKISEFTPAISSNKEHTNTANCQVIINNSRSDKEKKENNNLSGFGGSEFPTQIPEPLNVNYTPSDTVIDNEKDLYKHLAISFSNILKTNNPKLIANLIDNSGKVILSGEDLIMAISLSLGIDKNLIKINYEDPEANCLGKINPIKRITNIKVNGCDFNLMYNKQYNNLSDEFNISLKSLII